MFDFMNFCLFLCEILLIFRHFRSIMGSIKENGGHCMGESIAVLSGKGGTGKTSVCAGLAAALASAGKKVLCIDCDVGLRNLDISLGMTDSGALSFAEILDGSYGLTAASRHPRFPNLRFLTAPIRCQAENVDADAFRDMVAAARELYDYVFLDAPAGLDAGFRLAARFANRILLVTGADPASVRDAARTGEVLEQMGKRNVRLVVNRVDPRLITTMATTVDDVMDDTGLPLLGIVPDDRNVVLAAAFGQCLLDYSRRCPASKAFRAIAQRVQGFYEPLSIK